MLAILSGQGPAAMSAPKCWYPHQEPAI